jgi:hypothetical protein
MRTTSSDPIELLRAGVEQLVSSDIPALPDETVRARVRDLLTLTNQLQAALWAHVASFDVRGLADGDGLSSTRSWLCATGRLSPHAATTMLRRARTLRQLPAMATVAAEGSVTPEHVHRVVELSEQVGIGAVQEADVVLAELASRSVPRAVADACHRIRAHVDPDGPEPDPAADRRALTLSRFGDMVNVRGQLDLDAGAMLMTALDSLMRPPNAEDLLTPAQRRADALTELARLHLHAGTLPGDASGRPRIALLVTPDALLDRDSAAQPMTTGRPADDPLTAAGFPPAIDPPTLSWVGAVPPATAQRLACDSVIYRIVYDPATGQPLDVGRSHRTAPPWIRKALHARDGGCRWPGCDTPIPWCDSHHSVPWSEGGDTSVDTMLLLCRFHHTKVHEGQWRLTFDHTTAEVTITRPDGRPYELGATRPWLASTQAG